MASTELQKRKQEEYEMQLFSFHSRTVYAVLKSAINERIYCTIQKMCETIQKTYQLNSENLTILESNQKSLEKAYGKGAMPHLQNIKNIVNKCIAVPRNVLLEEDKYQRTQYSETEFENLKQKLEDLQQRAKKGTILNALLNEEMQILEQLPISENTVNEVCNTLENDLKSSDTNDKLYQAMKDYKELSKRIGAAIPMTAKMKYNTGDNLICNDFDLNTL